MLQGSSKLHPLLYIRHGRVTAFTTSSSAQTQFESFQLGGMTPQRNPRFQLLLLLHCWSAAGAEFHVIHPRVSNLHEQLARVRHATKALVIIVAATSTRDTVDLRVAPLARKKGLPAGDGGWLSK